MSLLSKFPIHSLWACIDIPDGGVGGGTGTDCSSVEVFEGGIHGGSLRVSIVSGDGGACSISEVIWDALVSSLVGDDIALAAIIHVNEPLGWLKEWILQLRTQTSKHEGIGR